VTHVENNISRDELRRQARELGATAARDAAAAQRVFTAAFESPSDPQQRRNAVLGRRDVFRIGGFSVATAAVLAACGGYQSEQLGRVGEASEPEPLPEAVVNDVVLLRTASSLEHSALAVYAAVVDNRDLLDAKYVDVVKRFVADHEEHAALFEKLTKDAGGTPWTVGNPRLDSAIIQPIIKRITQGADATPTSAAIGPSDDPKRDVLNFAHGLESLAGASYQALVGLLTKPLLRAEAINVGVREVRHAALLALTINPDRPGGLINLGDLASAQPDAPVETTPTTVQDIAAPTTVAAEEVVPQTPIPSVTAIPSQFGSLAQIQLVLGAGDVNGTRLKVNLDTPSLNSLVYEYLES
jgi:hypothetical protein